MSPALPILAITLIALASPVLADDKPGFPTTVFADDETSATVTVGDLTAIVTMERRPAVDPDLDVPVLEVRVSGRTVLEAIGAPSGFSFPATEASIAEIDPGNAQREVYFSSYSGGAHCCTQVIVATQVGDRWKAVDAGFFDGDGHLLRDLTGDGQAEIATPDNRFLYQFDAYAASFAPLQVLTIRHGELIDASREPQFEPAHRAWLDDMEAAMDGPNRWRAPGFLAGWVAAKQRVGEGLAAWNDLDTNWDHAGDEGEETCLIDRPIEECPRSQRAVLKFPQRLKLFLEQNGYPLT